MDWKTLMVAVLSSTVINSILTHFLNKKRSRAEIAKIEAETQKIKTDVHIALMEEYRKEYESIDRQKKEVEQESFRVMEKLRLEKQYTKELEDIVLKNGVNIDGIKKEIAHEQTQI